MQSEFVLQALEFGVLGLCAVTLILIWRLLVNEQSRSAEPRKGILQGAYVFMAFSILLALINAYVQLSTPSPVIAEGKSQEFSVLVGALYHKDNRELTIIDSRENLCGESLSLELAQASGHIASCSTRISNGTCEVEAYFKGGNPGEEDRGRFQVPKSNAEVPGHILSCIVSQ